MKDRPVYPVRSVYRHAALAVCVCVGTAFGSAVYDSVSVPGVLTVSVDIGGATLDAAQITDGITNIVKTGSGDLTSADISTYRGDITVNEGRYLAAQRGGLGADNAGTVYVNDGASLVDVALYGDWGRGLVLGKTIVFSGMPATTGLAAKFYREDGVGTTGFADWSTFRFLSDATARIDTQRLKMSGEIDLQGHALTFLRKDYVWQTMVECNCVVTNGGTIAVVGDASTASEAWRTVMLNANGVFGFREADAPCVLALTNAAFNAVRGLSIASAALYMDNARYYASSGEKSDVTTYRWNGPVNLSGSNALSDSSGSSLTFAGPFCGSGTLLIGPGWVNLFSGEGGDYSGDVTVQGSADTGASGIGLRDDSPLFPNAASVAFRDGAYLLLDGANHSAMPALTFTGDADASVIGGGIALAGQSRPTMAGLVKQGAGVLAMSNAVHVTGRTFIEGGTLRLGQKVYGHAGLWEWRCVDMLSDTAQSAWGAPRDVLQPLWVDGNPVYVMAANPEDATYSRFGATKVFDGFERVVSNGVNRATGYVYKGYVWNRSDAPVTWRFAFHQTYRGSMVVNEIWSPFGNPSENGTNIFETVLQPGANPIMIYSLCPRYNDRQDVSPRFDGLGLSYDPNPAAGETNAAHFVKLDDGGTGRLLTIDDAGETASSDLLPKFDDLAFAAGTVFDLNGNTFTQGRLSGFPAIRNGDLALAEEWTVAVDDIAGGARLTVDGTLSFAEGATISGVGETRLKCRDSSEYVIAAAASITGRPTLDKASAVLSNWKVVTTATEVRLVYHPRGLQISIR